VSRELRDLIQRMSKENPLWGCPYRKSKAAGPLPANRAIFSAMVDLFRLVWCFVAELFRSRAALQAEILVLRHQLNVLRRKSPKRLVFRNIDRLVFAGLYGLTPGVRNALKILKPGTVIAWHRTGFRAYWRWKSRPRGGRPKASLEARAYS